MKPLLGGKGKVAILVGSLTASNATQRIQGFEDAIKGTDITVAQKVNDNLSASTATSDAETILANNPDVNGLYGVYSYDGPALAQAVQSAGKTSSVAIVSDDSDAQTLSFIQSGVIGGTVVQMPYQQGYTGAFILAAEKVLGSAATLAIIKPYLSSDGFTLSSGVGLVTKSDLGQYQSLLIAARNQLIVTGCTAPPAARSPRGCGASTSPTARSASSTCPNSTCTRGRSSASSARTAPASRP